MLFKLSKGKDRSPQISPWVTYCDPEIAQVGLSEADARAHHGTIEVRQWAFGENDRAIAEGATTGQVKVVTGKGNRVLGAAIVGKTQAILSNHGLWRLRMI